MEFRLNTSEYTFAQENVVRVKVHLKSGVAEIFSNHQELMGKVDNNIIEVETIFENKTEKFLFVLQDAIVIVSKDQFDLGKTNIFVFGKRVCPISSTTSISEISGQCEEKKLLLETEVNLDKELGYSILNPKISVLENEIDFLKKILSVTQNLKK